MSGAIAVHFIGLNLTGSGTGIRHGGVAIAGGGVSFTADVCNFYNNRAKHTANVPFCGASLQIDRETSGSTVTLNDCRIQGTGEGGCGSAIALQTSASGTVLVLNRCHLHDSTSSHTGEAGALQIKGYGAEVTLNDCAVYGNAATAYFGGQPSYGGAMKISAGSLTLNNCDVYDNVADMGGALHASGASVVTINGGGFWNNKRSDFNGAGFSNSVVSQGGAIHAAATSSLTITSTFFEANIATGSGSAIYFTSSAPPGSPPLALFSNLTFRGHSGPVSMVEAGFEVTWYCALGQWSPTTGAFEALEYTGCANECLEGTYGAAHNLTAASQCTPCPRGQVCPSVGLAAGIDCPAGTRMPVDAGGFEPAILSLHVIRGSHVRTPTEYRC